MAGLNDFKCFVKSNPASLNVLCSMRGFIGLSVYGLFFNCYWF
jgi:hypothetical protein